MSGLLHDLLAILHLTADADLDDDATYLRRFPDIGRLSDDEIDEIAQAYLSPVDYAEADYHRVRQHLRRLRDAARATPAS